MTVALPIQVPASSSWQLVDWIARTVTSGPAGADGVATAEFEQLDLDIMWLVDHMVCQCTSTTDTRMRLYSTVAAPGALLDGSDRGNFDVGDWPAGLLVRPSTYLLAQWTGASAGAVCTLTAQIRVFRQ